MSNDNQIEINQDDIDIRYRQLKKMVVERKSQFKQLIDHLDTKTDWQMAPASSRFHSSRPRGLLHHSVNVAFKLLELKNLLSPKISDESCTIVGLFHDVYKAGEPGKPYYLKNQEINNWRPRYPYRLNNDLTFITPGAKSAFMVQDFIPITLEEIQAITHHDGQYVLENRGVAHREHSLTLLLQFADTWQGHILEKAKKID